MDPRERFIRTCLGQQADRVPFWLLWRPSDVLWSHWKEEGMPFGDWEEARRQFACDPLPQVVPVVYGPCPEVAWEQVEDTDKYSVFIDNWRVRHVHYKGIKMFHDRERQFPVRDRKGWQDYKSQLLDVRHATRFEGDWLESCRKWSAEGRPIKLGDSDEVVLLDAICALLGPEHGRVMDDCPDVIDDMVEHLTDLYLSVFERVVAAGVRVDMIHLSQLEEDVPERLFRRFLLPVYERIAAFATAHGIPVVAFQTSCWNVGWSVPALGEAGVNLFLLEAVGDDHVDVNEFQEEHPSLTMAGGIDRRVLTQGPQAIDAELARLAPAVRRGRYIPTLDWFIPAVAWEDYRYYAQRLSELTGAKSALGRA